MDTKLDIRALLQGTQYEGQAERIASKIEAGGLDDSRFIEDLPRLGSKIGGYNVNEVLSVIRQQMETEAGNDDSESDSEPEAEPEVEQPVWVKASDAAVALAEEHDIDLSRVKEGSGKGGLIIKSDVEDMIGNL